MFLFLLHMPKMYDDHAEILTEKNLTCRIHYATYQDFFFLKSCMILLNFINYLVFEIKGTRGLT